jgi:sialidase-1
MKPVSSVLSNVTTGVLYKNPMPHVKSVHAYFPSVAALPNGEMLATYVLAEAFEAVNARVHVARSADGGQTWQQEGAIAPGRTDRIVSEFGRVSISPDGELVVVLVRCDRTDHVDEGLANPATMGFVPTEVLLVRSTDCGRTWGKPEPIKPPLVGPFELCTPVVFLRDGRWLWPTSTWQDWEGNRPDSGRMAAFVSTDRGRTWPAYVDVMRCPDNNLTFWESKIVELSDGRLLAVAWCFDRKANADRPNQYAISRDGGATWTPPQSMGLLGQTLTPCRLPDDRVLSVYRRMDQPGLWAVASHLEGDRWVNDGYQPLWGHRTTEGQTAMEENMVETFHGLKFGAPWAIRLPNGNVFVVFWCYEENVSVIRWFNATCP